MIDDFPHMRRALEMAQKAAEMGEVPVGAVITDSKGRVIAEAHNRVIQDKDPSAHAEMLAIRAAAKRLGSERLPECDLFVTLEPCTMCAQVIAFARIRRLYYGADDPKGGGITVGPRVFSHQTTHHKPEIFGGILENQAGKILKDFFASRR